MLVFQYLKLQSWFHIVDDYIYQHQNHREEKVIHFFEEFV